MEQKLCKCGCGNIITSLRQETMYFPGHQNSRTPYKCKAYPNEIKLCECGCGQQIIYRNEFRIRGWPKYLYQHHMRIPKEKLYGSLEKFKEINQKISNTSKGHKKSEKFREDIRNRQKGISFEQRFGKEKTKSIRQKMSKLASRSYDERLGIEEANRQKQMRIDARLGKKYCEIFGPVKALEVSKKKHYSMPSWGKGKNEERILNIMEKILNKKIDRYYYVVDIKNKKMYKPDGYIKEDNLCVEVDEKYHYGKQAINDEIRENVLKTILNCSFLRINEEKFLEEYSLIT
jgi:hypothetical protein